MPVPRSWHPRTSLEFLPALKPASALLLQKILHAPLVSCEARRPRTATAAFYYAVHYVSLDCSVKCYDWRLFYGDGDVKDEGGGVGGAHGAAIISERSF